MALYERFVQERFDANGALVDISISYDENFNYGYDVVDAIASETPDKTALVWCDTAGNERIFSFSEIKGLSDRCANVLMAHGIGRGDNVMVSLKRHYEYWFVAIAIHKIGAVLVPVTHMLTAADFAYRFKAAPFKAVISTTDDDVTSRIVEAMVETEMHPLLFSVQRSVDGFFRLDEEMETAASSLSPVATRVSDPMLMYFTSGTTGYPKGVIHDHSYPLAHIVTARYWQQAEEGGLHFTVSETGWAKASWGKLYGQWLVGSAVMVYDFDNFDPKQLANIINRYDVTSFCAPPTVYRYLVKKGTPPMPNLKHASTAGEYLSPEVFKHFFEKTGLRLHEGYGQTETTLLTANYRGMAVVDGSMGKPSPLYDIALVDADGNPVPDGEIGEVVVKPKDGRRPLGVFCAYLDNPRMYEQAWRGGVYHTGDSAYRDKDGYFWFHGRFDDIIKSGGFRIGPFEIENILNKHPAVMECCVIGVPDPLRGQAVRAVIVLDKGFEAGPSLDKEIREFCNCQLAEYKWVRQICFVDALPKTISGKIHKVRVIVG
jgi:acetyl-CoA synthetase